MPPGRLALISLTALAAGGSFGGCGGASGEADSRQSAAGEPYTTITTSSIDKARFVDRANRYCHSSWAQLLHRFQADTASTRADGGKVPGFSAVEREFLLPTILFQFDELRILGAPHGELHQVAQLAAALWQALESSKRNQPANPVAFALRFGRFDRLARRYGTVACIARPSYLARFESSHGS